MLKLFSPNFVNKIDSRLITHYPVIWMSKIHFVLWWALLLFILSFALGMVVSFNLNTSLAYGLWYFVLTIPSVVVLCYWIYRYVIFNKEKNYGILILTDEYLNLFLTFFGILILLIAPCAFESVYNYRIAKSYTDEEIIRDINILNENLPYTMTDKNVFYSWKEKNKEESYITATKLNATNADLFSPAVIKYDSLRFPHLLTTYMLYKKYKTIYDKKEVEDRINTYKKTALKYNGAENISTSAMADEYLSVLRAGHGSLDYSVSNYRLEMALENVCEAKFEKLFIYQPIFLVPLFYIIISITSLLLLFKNTYWKQFLVALITIGLYPLIGFIISELIPNEYGSRSTTYMSIIVLGMLITLGSLFYSTRKRFYYNPVLSTLNQISYLTLMHMPFMSIIYLHKVTNLFHNYDFYDYRNRTGANETYYSYYLEQYWRHEYERWNGIALISGVVLYVALVPFFKQLFVKELSLPKRT